MNLLLIRHAQAIEATPGDLNDAVRPLTLKGHRQCRRLFVALQRLELQFEHLYHSPALRSVETAKAIMPLVRKGSSSTELLSGPPTEALLDILTGDPVALIGHQPWLGELAAILVARDRELGHAFPIRKGGLLWLVGEPRVGRMQLEASLPPDVLREIAHGT